MMQTRESILIPTPQQVILLEQFQSESSNKTITFSVLKKIFLSTLSNQAVTQEVLDIICSTQKLKIQGITSQQFLSYIKVITRQLSHHVQDSHSFGLFIGTQLLKLVDKKLIMQKQSEQLPVYKVPKELQEFLNQPDVTIRYSNDLLSQYQKNNLTYKKNPTYRLWNYQSETKQKSSNTFRDTKNAKNKYSILFRACFGLQFKFMLETMKNMQQNKQLKILQMLTKQFSDLEDLGGFDRNFYKFFKSRNTFDCDTFKPSIKRVFFEISRNKANALISMCQSLSKIVQNHYIKAILTYWGNSEDWTGSMFTQISFNDNISLVDRFFFAKWNMSKQMYTQFMQHVQIIGSTSDKLQYIFLFGKRPQSAQILQNYYDMTLDIETSALLSIYFIIGKFDGKTTRHQNIYQHLLSTYKTCLKNSNKNIILEVFQKKQRQIQAQQNIVDNRAISMKCNNCGCNLSLAAPVQNKQNKSASKMQLSQLPILHQCPFCTQHVHRCSTCLVPIQILNPTFANQNPNKQNDFTKQSTPIQKAIVFCLKCKHGGHFFHLYQWFIHQTACPIPECGCQCQL